MSISIEIRENEHYASVDYWNNRYTSESEYDWLGDYEVFKDLMKHKMDDADNSVKESKADLNKSKNTLNTVVRKGTFVRIEFMELVNKEVNIK